MRVLRTLLGLVAKGFSIDLAMDLGTANTLIYVKGEGIVVNEPSLVAMDIRTNQPVAIGRTALDLLGRGPEYIRVERPLKDGVIANFDAAMAMIKGFLGKVFKPRMWLNPRIVIGVPSGITQVEKRAVRESAYQAGGRHILLLDEPMAAAMGAGLDVEHPKGNMVVDIGGGTTEVAVISLCATAYCESMRVAGDEMNEAVIRYVRRVMHVEIAQSQAEQIKIRIGCARPRYDDPSMTVTGKQVGRGGPRTVEVKASQIAEALDEPVVAILDTVTRALEQIPPALAADVKERGVVLTGGGALLHGLDRLIEGMSGIRTVIADDPLTSVVRGCGMAIEDTTRWKPVFIA